MSDRIDALRRMMERRPEDPRMRFGLALEYLTADRLEEGVEQLRAYLDLADDEGNAWGRLGAALEQLGQRAEAVNAYRTGIEAAERHGHPTMAEEFRLALEDMGA